MGGRKRGIVGGGEETAPAAQRRPRCIAGKSGLERICRLSDAARGQLLYSNGSTDEGVLKEIILLTLQVVTLKRNICRCYSERLLVC